MTSHHGVNSNPPSGQSKDVDNSPLISDCHNASMHVVSDSFGEGTNHYECDVCNEFCSFHMAKDSSQDDTRVEIWERVYDNPVNDDGTDKPNRLLGKFRVIQWIYGSLSEYDCQFTGESNGKIYLVTGREVSFTNGGTRYELTKLNDLVSTDKEPI